MIFQKSKYKEATSFFGVDRMEKLESAIKEQSQRTKALQMKNNLMWHLKLTGAISLLIYSISATAFIIHNEVGVSSLQSIETISPSNEATPIKINNDSVMSTTTPRAETKITVKKGDSLATIAQRIIKTNGVKNTPVNRQMVISKLKDKNTNLQENDSIKYGWTLLSLSQKEIQQICKN